MSVFTNLRGHPEPCSCGFRECEHCGRLFDEKAAAALRRAEAQLERFTPGRERNEASSRIHSGLAFIARGYTRESGSGGRIGRGVVNSHLRWLARALRARK